MTLPRYDAKTYRHDRRLILVTRVKGRAVACGVANGNKDK